MKQIILAKRYAKALFMVAEEQKKVKEYGDVLRSFAEQLEKNAELRDVLVNPRYSQDVRQNVMKKLIDKANVERPPAKLLELLTEKKRIEILPEIAESYAVMFDESQNISHGTVITATKLTRALNDKIQHVLEKLTGKRVVLETIVDPGIIGGMIARVGDLELDGSIRTQIAGLKDSIKGR